MNLSGVETKLMRMIDGLDPVIANTVLEYIRDVLIKTLNNAVIDTGLDSILIAGGVASNSILRKGITEQVNADIYFASKELSTDNAVGIANLAYLAHKKEIEPV